MRSTIRLNLDMCILLNDITRMKSGQRPIKNIHRLALIIETRYDLDYDRIKDQMYKSQKTGYQQHDKVEGLDELIEKICLVLGASREDLIHEVEQ
ncbi:hypothetical protein MWU78_14415 [Arenibacter sp. F26102]|uniref:hypothetical protein n=1 Tax=Arenibacter sp. F26102 TaxID=2926416 RepID=UPI001FF11306|nr:hypothetical protein [Arenibacter sp. F26102]MCK0146848.1 hypothetical protein [Arenibacter sp. F26102]